MIRCVLAVNWAYWSIYQAYQTICPNMYGVGPFKQNPLFSTFFCKGKIARRVMHLSILQKWRKNIWSWINEANTPLVTWGLSNKKSNLSKFFRFFLFIWGTNTLKIIRGAHLEHRFFLYMHYLGYLQVFFLVFKTFAHMDPLVCFSKIYMFHRTIP